MPRKGEVKKREVLPDPKYGDKLVTKFINTIMTRGKKSVADRQAAEVVALRPHELRPRQNVPAHLHAAGATFFAHMVRDHGIVEAGALAVLTRAAECLDRIAAARQSIDKDGAIIRNQYDIAKAHPGLAVEKDARNAFYAAMRLLGIEMNAWGDVRSKRPPWNEDD